ncbi:phosphodiester glycosidase family protein [Breznakiella homolactica]|uniref:Phosphodiester glycosidase family protein n=1 Tax=Breznakiella homolactica TaxID=2798577 RepID=A0A7T7XML0_9SPIR|nr:phosphodiester glycosidase family protein [Breznakiella homolactica]QQO09057.1 phosphodiester glycosidase family protein [Breznakiella homolactica]
METADGWTAPEFPVPHELSPQWQSFSRGVDYFEASIRDPRLKLWALRIDLSDPAVSVVINDPGPAASVVESIKTTTFAETYGCAAAINTNPFDPASAVEGEERRVVGLAVSRGRVISPPDPRYGALVFYRSGKAAAVHQGEIQTTDTIENAAGGFFMVLENGRLPESVPEHRQNLRFPRSAAGVSLDGSVFYLLAIDGRRSSSVGATEAETGIILKGLGASSGLIFDGGGSTALALRFPDGKIRTLNTPVHGGIPGRERAVATCLGIRVLENPPEQPRDN